MPVPPLHFSPRSCAAVRPVDRWLPAPPEQACTMPRHAIDARLATSRAILTSVARKTSSARLRVVDPARVLCDERVCRAVIGGTLMYRDDNHLSDEGARFVCERIRPRDLEALTALENDHADETPPRQAALRIVSRRNPP